MLVIYESVKSISNNKTCGCDTTSFAFFSTTDDPGFLASQASLIKWLTERDDPKTNLTFIDLRREFSLYSYERVRKLFGLDDNPVNLVVAEHKNITKRVSSDFKSLTLETPTQESGGSAVRGDLYSFMKTDRLSSNFLTRNLERWLKSKFTKARAISRKVVGDEHFCFCIILNGRHAVDAGLAEGAKESGTPILYWEKSGTGRALGFLSNHPPQDYFSFREESQKLSVSEVERRAVRKWLSSRRTNSTGTNPFAEKWRSANTQLEANERVISFFTSSQDEYWSLGALFPTRRWESQYVGFESVLCQLKQPDDTVVVRMHPNTSNKSPGYVFREIKSVLSLLQGHPNTLVILPHDPLNSYSLIDISSVVISSASTVGAEALAMGKPVVHLDSSRFPLSSESTMYEPDGKKPFESSDTNHLSSLAMADFHVYLAHETFPITHKSYAVRRFQSVFSLRNPVSVFITVHYFINKITSRILLYSFKAFLRFKQNDSRFR